MYDMTNYGGNAGNKPATGISWLEAVKFVNYLNLNSGSPLAYKIDVGGNFQVWSPADAGYNSSNTFRNSLAKYFLPSVDEWYKGAYGSPNGTWYDFANASDQQPLPVSSGTSQNSVVWNGQAGPAVVDQAGGLSAWGTMAQSGNVWEWNETAFNIPLVLNTLRGGSWATDFYMLAAYYSNYVDPIMPDEIATGFRVAMIPEPSALSLLAVGLGVVLRRRRS
jgi:formylglycine-generating enzyme required for sulfatase activity